MSFVLICLIAGGVIVAAMIFVTPLLGFIPGTSDHYRGVILLAVIFAALGALFGAYQGVGVLNGVIDGVILFVVVAVIWWVFGLIRRAFR